MSIVHPEQPEHKYDIDPETGAVLLPLNGRKYVGLFALVDEDDLDTVEGYSWHISKDYKPASDRIYVAAHPSKGGTVYLHRLILGLKHSNERADHINHNGLDNRRCNLRRSTNQENLQNQRKTTLPCHSVYKGVSWHKLKNKWIAQVGRGGKMIFLGYFVEEIDAARAYDEFAQKAFGEYACLNFPEGESK